jgi:hypothetical protein
MQDNGPSPVDREPLADDHLDPFHDELDNEDDLDITAVDTLEASPHDVVEQYTPAYPRNAVPRDGIESVDTLEASPEDVVEQHTPAYQMEIDPEDDTE